MSARAGAGVALFVATGLVALVAGCRKVPKEMPPPLADAGSEAFALCREVHPCAPGQVYMCAIGGDSLPSAAYRAPGVRIERLYCSYRKMGEDAVIGIPHDGSPHLQALDLFVRVKGTPLERALAAAELVLDRPLDADACSPAEDEHGVLRFCVRGEIADSSAV